MKIPKLIHESIIDKAEQFISALRSSESSEKPKTDQQKKIDEWFATRGDTLGLADLVHALVGYRPTTLTPARKNFEILTRTQSGTSTTWIVLSGNLYGFSCTAHGRYQGCSQDKPATLNEAEAFVKSLRKLKSEDVARWCITQLGADFFLTL